MALVHCIRIRVSQGVPESQSSWHDDNLENNSQSDMSSLSKSFALYCPLPTQRCDQLAQELTVTVNHRLRRYCDKWKCRNQHGKTQRQVSVVWTLHFKQAGLEDRGIICVSLKLHIILPLVSFRSRLVILFQLQPSLEWFKSTVAAVLYVKQQRNEDRGYCVHFAHSSRYQNMKIRCYDFFIHCQLLTFISSLRMISHVCTVDFPAELRE